MVYWRKHLNTAETIHPADFCLPASPSGQPKLKQTSKLKQFFCALLFIALACMSLQPAIAQKQTTTLNAPTLNSPALNSPTLNPVVLNADRLQSDFKGHISYLLDETWQLTPEDMITDQIAARFVPVQSEYPNFGYIKSAIWLKFSVANQTATEADWRLFFRENFFQTFNLFQHHTDGRLTALILQDKNSVFASRPTTYPELVVPLTLSPGETTTFYLQYWSGGASDLSFSILTTDNFEAMAGQLSAKNFIYYGMMVLLTFISIIALIVARNPVFFAYAGYAAAALLFIMHADGNGFKYLWPNAPAFNAFATILFGSGMIGFGALFAKLFLQTKRYHPLMDKALIATIGLVITLVVSTVVVDDQLVKKGLVLLALLSIVQFILAGLLAARTRLKEVRFFLLAWSGALISSILMTSRHWLGIEISEPVQFDSIRIVMVSDAALMGLAIWDRINQLRKASHEALKASLQQAERNLKMNERLQELEARYQIVTQTAQQKDQLLADTLHDIRQPLYALRLNIHSLTHTKDQSKGAPADIESSFSYLENLVEAQLADAQNAPACTELETVKVDDILGNVHKTYMADAKDRGLMFHYQKTSAQTKADPLVLTRIVSNLVANAIKYTPTGKVLIGCRQYGDRLRIQVHDTGPGLSAEEFNQACQRAIRLENAARPEPGMGYGLAIITELCTKHNFGFSQDTRRQSGCSFSIEVPKIK